MILRRLICACCLLLAAFAPAAALAETLPPASDAAVSDSAGEIAALQAELAAVAETLRALESRSDELYWGRQNTGVFIDLGKKSDTLRERLTDIGQRIAALRRGSPAMGAALGPLAAALDDYGGRPLPASVGEGAVLAFEATLRHPDREEAQLANMLWQVSDADGRPLPNLAKHEQELTAGGEKKYRFRFRVADLANGSYRVRFTFQPAAEGEPALQREAAFTVHQPLRISRLMVAPDGAAARHSALLYPEQAPHLLVDFAADDMPTVIVGFTVTADGVERFARTVERQVESSGGEQRLAIRLDQGLIRPGEKAVFAATVTGPDGSAVRREVAFAVGEYALRIVLPDYLPANEASRFHIEPPSGFVLPLQVRLQPNGATASMDGPLAGQIAPIAAATGSSGSLAVLLTDAEGRTAKGVARFDVVVPEPVIEPPPPAPVADHAPSFRGWAESLDNDIAPLASAPPPAPPPDQGPGMAEALAKFNRDMAQIIADKQAAERKSNLERQQAMQKIYQQARPRSQAKPPPPPAARQERCNVEPGTKLISMLDQSGKIISNVSAYTTNTGYCQMGYKLVPSGNCAGGYMCPSGKESVDKHLRSGGRIVVYDLSSCPHRVVCQ